MSRLTNFAVYEKDMTDVTTAGRKGAIEVIDLDDHSAVAQIIDENVSNPILQATRSSPPLETRTARAFRIDLWYGS